MINLCTYVTKDNVIGHMVATVQVQCYITMYLCADMSAQVSVFTYVCEKSFLIVSAWILTCNMQVRYSSATG